jgi:tRNA (guanine-N7-)-methyltransferase
MARRYRSRGNSAIPERVVPVTDPCAPLIVEDLFPERHPLEVEIGAGNGRFLAARAAAHPATNYLAVERLPGRVRTLDRRASETGLQNIRIVLLEALYTFYYLLPRHGVRTVYIFFPDPWPKRRHHSHRLFSPVFLDALWHTLEIGGCVQVATDHTGYFEQIRRCLEADARFEEIPAMERTPEEQTDFELLFRAQGLPISQCAFRSLAAADEQPLPPLTLPPEMLPKA